MLWYISSVIFFAWSLSFELVIIWYAISTLVSVVLHLDWMSFHLVLISSGMGAGRLNGMLTVQPLRVLFSFRVVCN